MMNDGAGDAAPMAPKADGSQAEHSVEQCVPLAALAMPGEDEQMNTPSQGDMVEYRVEGKLTRIEGDNAYVMPDTINGKPAKPEEGTPKPDDEDQEFAQLKDMAQKQDEGMGMAA
jgi:hypothetical protein